MSKVTFIQISVGSLPEWYNEAQHDHALELAIEKKWSSNPAYTDAEIAVEYNYQTSGATVTAYDDDGDVVLERDNHDLAYAFRAAKDA